MKKDPISDKEELIERQKRQEAFKDDPIFTKVTLTERQKRQLRSSIKEIYKDNPETKKAHLNWLEGTKLRIIDLFHRKNKVNDTYEFFKPYYDLVGLKLTEKDAESIRYKVTTLAKKLRQIADEREI